MDMNKASDYQALTAQQKDIYLDHAIYSLLRAYPLLSTQGPTPLWLKSANYFLIWMLIALAIVSQTQTLIFLNSFLFLGISLSVTTKIIFSLIGFAVTKRNRIKKITLTPDILPIYSVLVPLYKEKKITLQSLFSHLTQLSYPAEKLDIKILLEEDDKQTNEIVRSFSLPSYIEIIEIPACEPRTKAKACNYGLQLVRGEYVCLYDAEDQPDRDQLLKAVQWFRSVNNEKLACVQCKLNFYNHNENWLTRLFAIEYTYWFDLLLPALERLRVPIPLGGTSNHFRVNILKQVHAWDPFNVTEDADLGLRLARFGFFTQVLHSTTFEEANCQLWNWVKQRTRWVKGYMQTYLVHMRTPVDLWKRVGTLGFIGFQLFVGGTILSNLLNIPMWILSFVLFNLPEWNIHRYFPKPLFYEIWLMNFLLGTVGIVVLNMLGVIAVKNKHLALSAFTAPLYWLLMSLASYRALYQLSVKPSYWDKTEHGISQTLIPD
jgi:cellulose synthase/poly-beta-1,6-N-acetylglucosamine synthase-like glycosyltransferase